jgi:hypothetical protein
MTDPIAGKQWLKSRPGQVTLAALAWTILGCVFACRTFLPVRTGAKLCFLL